MHTPEQPAHPSPPLTPVPACVARADPVLFFGGSFDPPHLGHARLPFEVAERWRPGRGAWTVFVPAARSPLKERPPAPDRHRAEMLRIALRGRRRWWIWEQELRAAEHDPGAPSYWADTWAAARRLFSARDRAFLIGADQAASMHRWRRYREFWTDALVMLREEEDDAGRFAGRMRATGAWTTNDVDHWVSRIVPTRTVRASSTAARAALAGRPDGEAHENARAEGLDPGVWAYAERLGLYTPA